MGWGVKNKTDSEILSAKAIALKKEYTLKKGIARRIKNDKIHRVLIKKIADIILLPKKNEQYMMVTQMSFNIYSLILFILESEKKIDELVVTTFNMNKKTFDGLINLCDCGKVQNLKIVISESITFRMPERIKEMVSVFESKKYNYELALVWNHTKIGLIKCKENHYVIEGSGNFSDNSEIEQYRFENNKESFDFHYKWINDLVFEHQRKKRSKVYKK